MPMIHFQEYLLNKQAEWGRPITVKEIAGTTGLSRDTITRLVKQRTTRVDEGTVNALCKFFGVERGEPIPFLIYDPDEAE